MSDKENTRLAIIDPARCRPKRCNLECKTCCPVVRTGKLCVEVTKKDKVAFISATLCIGCNLCVKKCPMNAISIIRLPKNLEKETTHRYGPNSFKLHRLPMPRPGQVLGLIGSNGTGKSTALKILSGKLKPNLGQFDDLPSWETIIKAYRGSELQNYFTKIVESSLVAKSKPQYVDALTRVVKGKVGDIIESKHEMENMERILDALDLNGLLDRDVSQISGGELQRFAIAVVCVQKADVYMFDEPSSYLDVKQRLNAARVIRSMVAADVYAIVIDHDLGVADYLADYVCVLYGTPGAYGVVTAPFGVRDGINIFLAGFVPTENLRFRTTELTFRIQEKAEEEEEEEGKRRTARYQYPAMTKTLGSFKMNIDAGDFTDSECIVLLGENGTGKTTFIRILAGLLKPDDDECEIAEMNVSYKPQKIAPKFDGSVRSLLHKKIRDAYLHPQFVTDVVKPMMIEELIDQDVKNLSGGELQRVAITLCLGQPADIYLIDEPSAYLDSEQRIVAARVIKRAVMHGKKTAWLVEHDLVMCTGLADRVVVLDGEPSKNTHASPPMDLVAGMNQFLKTLDVTFRRDEQSGRPRINKYDSQADSRQKSEGTYFFLD